METAAPRHSRTSLLLRVLAAALVVVAAVALRDLVDDERAPSATAGSRVVDFTVDSQVLGEQMPVEVVVPPGARDGRRSLLVFLHGRSEDESSYLVEPMFKALRREGGKAPVVAFPRGGPDSYWHDREDGRWGTYVSDELVPELTERFEIEPERVAIGGISMGGFGALDIARLDPDLFCSVGAHSPAIWANSSDTAPGAFDNDDDFSRHNVIEAVGPPNSPLAGKRVWVDFGDEDPFIDADEALIESLEAGGADVRTYEGQGEHETSYWNDNWRRYMRFYGRSLKACQTDGKSGRAAGDGERRQRPGEDDPERSDEGGSGAGAP